MESPEKRLAAHWEDQRRRRLRGRLGGYALCVPLWLVSVVPLARDSMDGRDGAGAVAVYLIVGALTLGAAAVVRGLYAFWRKRPFWSPWLFVMAAALAIGGYAVQSAGEEVPLGTAHAVGSSGGTGTLTGT